jgi:hypothetical protein
MKLKSVISSHRIPENSHPRSNTQAGHGRGIKNSIHYIERPIYGFPDTHIPVFQNTT